MNRFIVFVLAISFLAKSYSQSQALSPQWIGTVPKTLSFLAYDAFNYRYSIDNNVFQKSKTSEIWEYKNVSLGTITKIDLQNPLKIAVFYGDFNSVILLDNQLNETQRINFSEQLTPINATAVGVASQNRLWIYNNLNQQIGLYDYQKKEYKTISTPLSIKIKQYITDYNSFVWVDENDDVYVCSLFGGIEGLGKIPKADQIQIINSDQILCSINQKMIVLTRQKDMSWSSTSVVLPEKRFEKFYYQAQILAIFTAEGISNFKIILP